MKIELGAQIRRSRFLYANLRELKYTIWNTPGVGQVVPDPPELRQMEDIGRRSSVAAIPSVCGSSRILFFTFRGWSTHVAWDATIAAALRLRGADVQFFTCGKRVQLCDIASYHASPPTPCSFCAPYVRRALSAWHFPVKQIRDLISASEVDEIRRQVYALSFEEFPTWSFDGVAVGKFVSTSVRWYMCSGTIGDDTIARRAYLDFLVSGATIVRAGIRLLDTLQPDQLFLLNGLFFAERIMMELAFARGLPVVTYESGFVPDTLVFAHDSIAPYYDLDAVWPSYRDLPLNPAESAQLDDYLIGRMSGSMDAARYFPTIERDEQAIRARLGLDSSKRLVVAFTNILWDSAILDRNRAYPGMIDWLDATIKHFVSRRDVELVIRIHPAEVRLDMQETREQVGTILSVRYPSLPSHVKIIPPESDVSSYTLMHMASVGLVYTSTTGLEMALEGKPVIVAGLTHYAGKGFTRDMSNPGEYEELLSRLEELAPLGAESVELARRYAYLFFFRFMLPFPPITMIPRGRLKLNFDTIGDLRPGHFPALDLICDSILNRTEFIRPRTA